MDCCLCVFSGMATVYVRYKQVQALTGEDKVRLHRLNSFGLLLGIISSLGMCVVANFQVSTTRPGFIHTCTMCEHISC